MAAGKGRSAGGGQVGEENRGRCRARGVLMRGRKIKKRKVGNLGHRGGWGERRPRLVGGRGISEIWPKEGVKWKRDRERYSPLSLFEFVVLIDNTVHFFCMGGGGDMIQHKCNVNLWK